MNENLNLFEKLKHCPEGTEFYSTIHGKVSLYTFDYCEPYPIGFSTESGNTFGVTTDGKYDKLNNGECIIFPSKYQRDWSKFKLKFDPSTLKPFDKVLVRDDGSECWEAQLFSHIIKDDADFPYVCTNDSNRYCIPYNDDTKHLVGTDDEAPEFYRYWEY